MADGKHRAEASPEPGQHIPVVRPDIEDDKRGRKVRNRRPGPRHEAAQVKAPRVNVDTTRIRPRSAAPASPAPGRWNKTAPLFDRSSAVRARRLAAEGHEYAVRQAVRATSGRPSVTGRALSGGAAGAATGAAIGSVVPGVGTAAGAATGGGVGAVAGGVAGARAKKAFKAAMRPSPGARKALVAEFGICMVVVGLSPLTDRRRDEPPGALIKRLAALLGLFFVLGLVSAGGRSMARVAASFGALVAVALLVSERDLFTKIAAVFANRDDTPAVGSAPEQVDIAKAAHKIEVVR